MRVIVVSITMGIATVQAAENFSRYQVILDKAPFGAVTARPPTDTPSSLTRYAFVGLVSAADNADQVLAIIYDKQTRRHYFKAPGEMVDDVKVVRIEAEFPAPRLLLQRGLETATLSYEERRPAAGTIAPRVPGGTTAAGVSMPPDETAPPEPPTAVNPTGPRRPFRR